MDRTNAERQRRYIAKLKQHAGEPHSPDMVLAALERLQPYHFPKGTLETFAQRLRATADRLSPVSNATPEILRSVSDGDALEARVRELEAELDQAEFERHELARNLMHGISFSSDEYRQILSCLHPDALLSCLLPDAIGAHMPKYERAFQLFKRKFPEKLFHERRVTDAERRAMDAKKPPPMPRDVADLAKRKAAATAERRAKRAASKAAKTRKSVTGR